MRHRRVATVLLRALPVGARFYPPRVTARRVALHRVWGQGRDGTVFVQAFERQRRPHNVLEWGPAMEWSGEVLVEPLKRRKR